MIFTITSINKDLDIYTVVNETNEQKVVSGIQIVSVMVNGYQFNNAKLTNKGFAVVTTKGTRYVQVAMTKDVQLKVASKVKEIAAREEVKKSQMSKAVNSDKVVNAPKPIGRPPVNKSAGSSLENVNIKQKIEGRKTTVTRIIFRGKHYYGINDICKKFNVDPKVFMERYEKGYTTEECLGLVPLRSDKELAEFKAANQRVINSMARQRGEF